MYKYMHLIFTCTCTCSSNLNYIQTLIVYMHVHIHNVITCKLSAYQNEKTNKDNLTFHTLSQCGIISACSSVCGILYIQQLMVP